jgi:hypothetical protein
MLDQYPHGDLVRQPDVRFGEPSVGDLAAQHLDMLGDACRQAVAELLVGVEPVEFVVRAGRFERGPGDLRGARQRGRRARVEQPRPAPHQRDEEQLDHRIQVQRQQRAVAVRRPPAAGFGRARPSVPSGNGHRELQSVVQHGARAHHGGPRVHEPAAGRLPLALHAGQPDPVPVTRYVERVRPADIGDPGAFRAHPDHPGSPGEPASSRDRQVHLWPPPEHQLAAFGEPDNLARRGTDVRGHRASVGPAARPRGSLDPGIALFRRDAVSSGWRGAGRRSCQPFTGAGGRPGGPSAPARGEPVARPGGARRSVRVSSRPPRGRLAGQIARPRATRRPSAPGDHTPTPRTPSNV